MRYPDSTVVKLSAVFTKKRKHRLHPEKLSSCSVTCQTEPLFHGRSRVNYELCLTSCQLHLITNRGQPFFARIRVYVRGYGE